MFRVCVINSEIERCRSQLFALGSIEDGTAPSSAWDPLEFFASEWNRRYPSLKGDIETDETGNRLFRFKVECFKHHSVKTTYYDECRAFVIFLVEPDDQTRRYYVNLQNYDTGISNVTQSIDWFEWSASHKLQRELRDVYGRMMAWNSSTIYSIFTTASDDLFKDGSTLLDETSNSLLYLVDKYYIMVETDFFSYFQLVLATKLNPGKMNLKKFRSVSQIHSQQNIPIPEGVLDNDALKLCLKSFNDTITEAGQPP